MIAKLAILAALLSASTDAFVVNHQPRAVRPATCKLNLEDHIASMIDQELIRLAKKEEMDRAWHEKNQPYVKKDLPENFDFEEATVMQDVLAPRQRRKDKRLAKDDPQAYCADRCIATGNCEVFEDIFDLSPREVMAFCEECVLSDDEEPCDVPEALFEGDGYDGPLTP